MDWIASKNYTTNVIREKLMDYSKSTTSGFYMYRKTGVEYLKYTSENMTAGRTWADVSEENSIYCPADLILRPEVIQYFKDGTALPSYVAKLKALKDALESMKVPRD